MDSKFIFYIVTSSDFVNAVSGKQYGVSYPAVKDEQVREQIISLPPFNEQHRIVAKLEELFSELDKGVESLKTAREQLKVYRQAVLKHAFEGKLTARWREENEDKLDSPEQLFTRIQKERETRYKKHMEEWRADLEAWKENGQVERKPPKPRSPKPVTALSEEVLGSLPGIPGCWIWEKLGWMTCGVEYGTAAKSSESGEVPVIRMGNLQNGVIDWGDLVFTSDRTEIEKYSLIYGDVLFNRTNSPELVGKTAIYGGGRPALFAGYLIRINHIETVVDGRFLNFFLNSRIAKQYGSKVRTDGVNQSNINGEKLQNYPFPYCSLEEQREIVRIIEEKVSFADRLLNGIDIEIERAQTLRHSLLKKAFSGQLVPQDPADEPAAALLERIRAEKATAPKRAPRKNRAPRKKSA